MLQSHYYKGLVEAGTDEAGRGCLAGPVYAAAVILPDNYQHPLLNDSKQLSDRQRRLLRSDIERDAVAWAVGICSPQEIDKINILNASILAMHRALDALATDEHGITRKNDEKISASPCSSVAKTTPEAVIVDGNRFKPWRDKPYTTIVKGDGKMMAIAAASILAKTYRDDCMIALAQQYPQYGWDRNMGYPTKQHRDAIRKYGLTEHHRLTFNQLGVKELEIPFAE
ncbi:MAG: ribonuclease HII [Prevotella sp.]|nr:ribonuclease HII [Prevotella sp.]